MTAHARGMLHEGADAVWPHGDFVTDCWVCRCIAAVRADATRAAETYPTAWAYEQACRALSEHKAEVAGLRKVAVAAARLFEDDSLPSDATVLHDALAALAVSPTPNSTQTPAAPEAEPERCAFTRWPNDTPCGEPEADDWHNPTLANGRSYHHPFTTPAPDGRTHFEGDRCPGGHIDPAFDAAHDEVHKR